MRKDIDWLVEDERARKAYEAEKGKQISYGDFREFHSELVPSKHKSDPQVVKYARNYSSPHYNRQMQLTDEDDEEIAEKYKDGMSIEQIAREMRVTAPTIRAHLQNMGLTIRASLKKDWTDADVEILRNMYLKGYTLTEIAEALNRSKSSVKCKVYNSGIYKHKKEKPPRNGNSESGTRKLT